jgi:hypothetical protein
MHYANLKTSLRAAKDKQWGRMRPAGHQFDMPALEYNLPKKRGKLCCYKSNHSVITGDMCEMDWQAAFTSLKLVLLFNPL